MIRLYHADCLDVLRGMPDSSVDAVVTDPPYGLSNTDPKHVLDAVVQWAGGNREYVPATGGGFMGKDWDSFVPPPAVWDECFRVLKPGGHLLSFAGTRTVDLMGLAVRLAGFEIRDSLAYLYGSGFPKSRNISVDPSFCQCANSVKSSHGTEAGEQGLERRGGASPLRSMWGDGEAIPEQGQAADAGVLRVQLPVSVRVSPVGGESIRPDREAGDEAIRRGQPGLEGRGDVRQGEGQLHRPALRPVSAGVPTDGPEGRLRHGASASDGSVDRPDVDPDGVREPHQPEPTGQPPRESGVVPDERGPQARGVWPVCAGCGKSVVPSGLGTALKPAFEPVIVARKPLVGTVAQNVLTYGTGALNIDATRIGTGEDRSGGGPRPTRVATGGFNMSNAGDRPEGGRWPANVVLDDSQAEALDQQSGSNASRFFMVDVSCAPIGVDDLDARFMYAAKAPQKERPSYTKPDGTVVAHPTVKPLAIMRWLVRLVTPPGGVVLDPFAGSGATLEAALLEGFDAIGVEREADYLPMIQQRVTRNGLPEVEILSVPRPTVEPEPLPEPELTLADRVLLATTREELSALWQEAKAAGVPWTPELTRLGKQRLAELEPAQ